MRVFASGSFDLVHAGHIEYLRQSAMLGDELHVSIAVDEYIKKKKGPGYPIYPYEQREFIIESLGFVTKVYEAPATTPEEFREDARRLIKLIQPAIITTGWERTAEHWAKQVAKDYGIMFVSLCCEVVHTTDIIEKIRGL